MDIIHEMIAEDHLFRCHIEMGKETGWAFLPVCNDKSVPIKRGSADTDWGRQEVQEDALLQVAGNPDKFTAVAACLNQRAEFAIDIDIDDAQVAEEQKDKIFGILGPTTCVRKGRLGRLALIYRTDAKLPENFKLECGNIEFQSTLINVAGSCSKKGITSYYRWEGDRPWEVEVPWVEKQLDALAAAYGQTKNAETSECAGINKPDDPAAYAQRTLDYLLDDMRTCREGGRHQCLIDAAMKLEAIDRAQGSKLEKGWPQQLRDAALHVGLPPSEVDDAIQDMRQQCSTPYWPDAEGEGLLLPPENRDTDNARDFADHYGDRIRCVGGEKGQFYLFDGSVWQRDDEVGAVRTMMLGCFTAVAKAKIDNALSLLKSVPGIPIKYSAFDPNPWHLGTPDGVIDLRSGEKVDARTAMVTKQTAVAPKEGIPRRWMRFLEEVTGGDKELAAYLQKIAGYCLTGSIQEHALFFIFGPGGSGKSVFIETLQRMLGGYALAIGIEALEEKSYRGIPTDIADLRGVRLAIASETADGKAWDAQRMKALTGGDSIQARAMREDFFRFEPSHKFVIAGNSQPYLRDAGAAEFRRMNIIPFMHAPKKVNKRLMQELQEEWPQILSWALEGARLWLDQGLEKPEVLEQSLQSYMSYINPFNEFCEERLVFDPEGFITGGRATAEWNDWWEKQSGDPDRKKKRGQIERELIKRGARVGRRRIKGKDGKTHQQRGYFGVRPRVEKPALALVDSKAPFDPTEEVWDGVPI